MLATYHAFTPGPPHPSKLYASTVMANAFTAPPSAEECARALHPSLAANDALSAPQRDALVLARLKHERRLGFIVSDGTGCGKGREGAGIAFNGMKLDEMPLAIFCSGAQLCDALRRDVKDLKLGVRVHDARDLNGKLPSSGILFLPYTYASGVKGRASLLDAIVKKYANTLLSIVCDEAHTIKRIGGSKTALAFASFLSKMRAGGARLTFMSATIAASVKDLAYLAPHVGLCGHGTRFKDFAQLRSHLSSRGDAGALEFLSSELVATGALISRTIGYDGVKFHTERAPLTDATRQCTMRRPTSWETSSRSHFARVNRCARSPLARSNALTRHCCSRARSTRASRAPRQHWMRAKPL